MTFRQMELFAAVCEHKSINRASAVHFISQQGISKMIHELETELGCVLLNRTKQGVTPTQQGAYLLEECLAMLERKNHLCQNLATMEDFPQEIISIGMAFGMASALPTWVMADFERLHPSVHIDYNDQVDFYLEHLLKKEEFDFCVTTGVLDHDVLQAEKLFDEAVYLCIPKTHMLYTKEEISMEDLIGQGFAMFSAQFHIRHNFIQTCQHAGFEPSIAITSNDFNSLKEIARHNNLLFVVPVHTVHPSDTLLRYVPFPLDTLVWSSYFVRKKSKPLTSTMLAFYHFLKEQLENPTAMPPLPYE